MGRRPLVMALFAAPVSADEHPPLAKAPFNAEQASEFQQRWAKHVSKPAVHTNSIGMKIVLLPPGEFTMGRTEEEFRKLNRNTPEAVRERGRGKFDPAWSMLMMPARRVRITKPFYMGATEVTVAQYRRFCEESGYKTEAEQGLLDGKKLEEYSAEFLARWKKRGRRIYTWREPRQHVAANLKQHDDEPVLHLCWNDCVAFCKWLSEEEGVEYSLPTEAQWEYACRSGTTTPWSFADFETYERFVRDYAFVSTQNPKTKKWTNNPRPSRVGIRKPNAFGLYDMHGNVWEYVADYWHRLSYKESPLNDPTGPAVQSEKGDLRRIIRGGSYDWARWGSQSIYRMRITQRSTQHPHQGFRVAMRIKGIKGAPPAVDPDAARRQKARDPGANSAVVRAALKKSELKRQLPSELTINIGNHKMEFVLIPAGSFLMGSEKGPRDERPIHRVVISKPFYMAKYVVTQSLWERLLGKDKRLAELRTWQGDMTGPAKAMNGLTWHDCQRFIAALKKEARIGSRSRETSDDDRKPPNSHEFGYEFSLPTEAQWEYACRAGGTTEFSFGDDPSVIGEYAQFAGNMRWGNPPRNDYWFHDVGLKKSNKFGLYDMHGGVWEWCADWYDEDYYFDSPLADPKGPESGRFRVLRGGSWFRYPKYARSAYRRFCHPNINSGGVTAYLEDFGCRVVINLDDTNKVGRISNPSKKKKDELETRPTRREVNYTKLARGLVRYSKNPVIEVGKKGQWNDQTLGCFTVLDDGDTFYFYSGGARFGKGKNVGMATSKDGVNWTYFDKNPLFAGAMPYAIKVGDTFRLYHPTGGGLQLRTSKDGFRWSQPKKVMSGCMDPCVVQVAENKYHMYFCDGGRIKKDGKQVWQFKNYVATSGDGITWKRQPKPVLPLGAKGTWDEASHAGPCVLKLPDGFHMWYLGSGPMNDKIAWRIGHATSPDGVNWTKSAKEPVLDVGKPGAWDQGTFMSFDIIYRDGKFLFWYAAAPTGHGDETKMRIQIGHGTSK